MMDCINDDEEIHFFDARDDVSSISNGNFDGNSCSTDCFECSFPYDVWLRSPESVKERRGKFLRWMGLTRDRIDFDNSKQLRDDELCSIENFENLIFREERTDSNAEKMKRKQEDFERISTSSSSVQIRNRIIDIEKRHKKNWLRKLRYLLCVVGTNGEDYMSRFDKYAFLRPKFDRIKVHHFKKKLKELSALYMGQDIRAHNGAILTMKFSPDGRYLASGGEDGIVRLWQVVEDQRSNEKNILKIDPACIYFMLNHLSELKPLFENKENTCCRSISLKKTSESACIIFPNKVFSIVEKPLHDYFGHNDEISDLSWSKNNYLLSSSVDKTVRLWRVGYDDCIKVFSHTDYVTCVQFNPVDDDHFISGSIDGKFRIWRISTCQVVDWIDIREIVTAISYRPDGQGAIIGSMTGDCRFYNIADNRMQLDAQISFNSKKKSGCKKITGFQYFPQDSSKVMVTCADSYVRILHGFNVVGKYKGFHNAGNQIPACFTYDGKYIVSACGNSDVYLWNSVGLSHGGKFKSYEHFSTNASIAVPWSGSRYCNTETLSFSALSSLEYFPKGSTLWPEEKLPESTRHIEQLKMHKSRYKFLKASCQKTLNSHAWGIVIVTASRDGRIKSFHNYGLPVPV